MLTQLGTKPLPIREAIFFTIGKTLGTLCHVSGWFLPMYGAGRLERRNIVEYERAAMYALRCGREDLIDCLVEMAEVEWEHDIASRSGYWPDLATTALSCSRVCSSPILSRIFSPI